MNEPRNRANHLNFVTISLAIVAIALAALLGGLSLRNSALGKAAARTTSSDAAGSDAAASGAVASDAAGSGAAPAASMDEPALPSAKPVETATVTVAPAKTVLRAPISAAIEGKPDSGLTPASKRQPASYKFSSKPFPPLPKPKILVFIVDDAGYSMNQLEPFLRLPFALTIAVLPGLPYSVKAAQAVRAAGKELILHQPMQALGGQNPGPGAILLGMGKEEIEAIVEANLETVPGAIGMNNHMGSAATTDLGIMEAVTAVAKRRGIYYVDSLTTSGTAVAEAARREGIPYWERNVFLDNAPDRASIFRAVEDGKKRATKDRPAVMIGHVWSAELAQALTDLYPQLVEEGFSLSTISRFMVQEAEEDDASSGN